MVSFEQWPYLYAFDTYAGVATGTISEPQATADDSSAMPRPRTLSCMLALDHVLLVSATREELPGEAIITNKMGAC